MTVPMGSSGDVVVMRRTAFCRLRGADAITVRHSGMRAQARRPGIHNPGQWLWIPGSPLRGNPERQQEKAPVAGGFLFSHRRHGDQWASAQTFFLVKYIR